MRWMVALTFSALSLAACVPSGEALHGASLSSGPGAPGFLIVGLAEQNYRWDLASWTQSIALTLTSPGQAPVVVTRRGCGSISGLVGDRPCVLSTVDHVVLQLPPGQWTPTEVVESYHFPDGDHTLRAAVPLAPVVVRPGQIAYAGDFIFASDADTQSIRLAGRSRDDARAQRALAPFTHLRSATVAYAGP